MDLHGWSTRFDLPADSTRLEMEGRELRRANTIVKQSAFFASVPK